MFQVLTKFSIAQKLRTLIVLNHGLVLTLFFVEDIQNYYWFLTFISLVVIGKIGGEIGFHRYFSHKGFTTLYWKDRLLLVLGSLNMVGSSISWCGTHRTHHVHTDKIEDPHSPYTQNWFDVWILNWRPFIIKPRYVSDFIRDPWHNFIHKYYFELCILILCIGMYIDFTKTIFLLSLPSVIQFHVGSLLIDIVCHKWGYRNFETKDQSRNNIFVNLFTGGSGLHNNHHANPGDWYYVKKRGEWDIWGLFIKYFLLKK
jgi:stearoyl-CoA desaturase (delta-9 desaturase)